MPTIGNVLERREAALFADSFTSADVVQLGLAILGGIVVAALLFLPRQWRLRERQLTMLASLAQLHGSSALDDATRDELAERLREGTEDYLHGDTRRRAAVVQQWTYLFFAVVSLTLFWLAQDRLDGSSAYVAYGASAIALLIGVLLTNGPASKSVMARVFRSYRSTQWKDAQWPVSTWAVQTIPIRAGDRVALLCCVAARKIDAIRAAVDDEGSMIVEGPRPRQNNLREYIHLRGWKNVVVVENDFEARSESFDAVVVEDIQRLVDAHAETVEWAYNVLRPGGRLFTVGWGRRWRSGISAEDLEQVIRRTFEYVHVMPLGRRSRILLATKAAPAASPAK